MGCAKALWWPHLVSVKATRLGWPGACSAWSLCRPRVGVGSAGLPWRPECLASCWGWWGQLHWAQCHPEAVRALRASRCPEPPRPVWPGPASRYRSPNRAGVAWWLGGPSAPGPYGRTCACVTCVRGSHPRAVFPAPLRALTGGAAVRWRRGAGGPGSPLCRAHSGCTTVPGWAAARVLRPVPAVGLGTVTAP